MGFSKPQVGFGRSVSSPNNGQPKNSNISSKYKLWNAQSSGYSHINIIPEPRTDGKKKITTEELKEKTTTKLVDYSKPRDLYNRENRMQNYLDRVNELPNPDRDDILTHIQYLTDNRRAALTIIRNISALTTFRQKLGMPFRDATSKEMRETFAKLENEGYIKNNEKKEYSSWADKKFRDVIKKFYRVVFTNDEDYPEAVRWIKTKFIKDKTIKKLDPRKFLTREQIIELIDNTQGTQRKALLAIGYELGTRPGELMALTNISLREEDGELFCTINESKTDERVLKIVEYKSLLKQWLANHPLKHLPIFPLWISEATNSKNKPMGIYGAEKIAKEMISKLDSTKKSKLYTLRHSRATFLAKCGWSETQLCLYFGWEIGSDQPKTYITLTSRDLDQAISALYGDKQAQKEMEVVLDTCLQCHQELYPNAPFCAKCGHSTSVTDSYRMGSGQVELKNEVSQLTERLKKMEQILSVVTTTGQSFPILQNDGNTQDRHLTQLSYADTSGLTEKEFQELRKIRTERRSRKETKKIGRLAQLERKLPVNAKSFHLVPMNLKPRKNEEPWHFFAREFGKEKTLEFFKFGLKMEKEAYEAAKRAKDRKRMGELLNGLEESEKEIANVQAL